MNTRATFKKLVHYNERKAKAYNRSKFYISNLFGNRMVDFIPQVLPRKLVKSVILKILKSSPWLCLLLRVSGGNIMTWLYTIINDLKAYQGTYPVQDHIFCKPTSRSPSVSWKQKLTMAWSLYLGIPSMVGISQLYHVLACMIWGDYIIP